MFDDPQKELKRLEQQLQRDEEFERFYQDIFREFGTPVEENRAAAPQPVRKAAPEAPRKSAYTDAPRAVAPAKKKSNLPLVLILCLEVAGIMGVAAYWLAKFL